MLEPLREEELQLLFELPSLYKKTMFERVTRQIQAECGLSRTQIMTLIFISLQGGCSMSCLADYLGLENSSFTTVAAALVEYGYVERGGASDDRRKTLLYLTEKGHVLAERIHNENIAYFEEQLGKLPVQERRSFLAHVEGLFRMLEQLGR